MESIIGLAVFIAVACGVGYFLYTRIMKKKAEAGQPRAANPARRHEPAPAPVEPSKEP